MTRDEERDMIGRVLDGDAAAFETLVLANQRKVYTLCLRMTGNPEDAEDLAQEAFIKAYQNLENFKGESGFGAWLYRLTSNVCIDYLRREKRREKSSLTYLDEAGAMLEFDVPDDRLRPDVAVERRQVQEGIRRGLDRLSPEHRAILILREMNGLSYEEIGVALDLSAGTVKSRIARARSALGKFLLTDGNFSERNASKEYSIGIANQNTEIRNRTERGEG